MTATITWRQAARLTLFTLLALLALASVAAAKPKASKAKAKPAAAASTKPVTVTLDTTKGKVVLAVHPEWSPLGAAHFLELVNAKFYDGAPWFRVLDGFVAQCGVAADPKLNATWENKTIKDEAVLKGNTRGRVAFGKTGLPNSRSTHIFISLADNTKSLDPQGFSAFAEVVSGMDVVDKFTRCEFQDQGGLGQPGGMKKFKDLYPKGDFIKTARVTGGKSKSRH